MPRQTISFHNDPALRRQFISSSHNEDINLAWEKKYGLPQSYGWLLRHLFGMMRHRAASRAERDDIDLLRTRVIFAMDYRIELGRIKLALLLWLLREVLPEVISGLEPEADVMEIITTTAQLRERKDTGNTVHSGEWEDLTEIISEMSDSFQNQKGDENNCLIYTLRAVSLAAQKNNSQTLANTVREAVNAMEAKTQTSSNAAYLKVSNKLLELLTAAIPITQRDLIEGEPDEISYILTQYVDRPAYA